MDTRRLIKYIEGNSTQEEKDAIARWLDSDEKNWNHFLALRKTYDFTLGHLDKTSGRSLSPARKKRSKLILELQKVAAVVVLSFGCFYLFSRANQSPEEIVMHTIHVPAGQRAELVLADGTSVWLNAKTTLTYPNRFINSKREVRLNGEAYFTVKHHPDESFIVHAGPYMIQVLGTEFNVSAYAASESFETSLLRGSVEVSSVKTNESVVLSPNERVFIEDGNFVKTSIQHFSHFLWRNGLISFENERMETIINKLRLYYDVDIQVENKKLLDLRYTGKFWTKDGVEHVIKVLRIHANFEYKKDNEQNMIILY